MKEFLQGKWLKHPLHPILVHIPTALWPAALLFDVLANLRSDNALVQAAFYMVLFGWGAALVAIPAGLADWWDIKPGKPARQLGVYHMVLNITATVLWGINLLLRLGDMPTATSVGALPLALSVVGTLILVVSGYLGGRMVYHYGIGIGRLSKGRWRKVAERGGARVPKKEEAAG
ncbi:MAG TPA: DUF2231 domain-containing protein [Chloroflexia bacterium]|jgi:uncharacterized membrane protein